MIGPYRKRPAECREHDLRVFEAAALLASAISERLSSLRVEHIGSTSVAGCAGKGILDLAVLYPPGALEEAKRVLAEMGFQPQSGRDPWPESRPMRVGSLQHAGETFLIHAHVLEDGCGEAAELLEFRDMLRANPERVREYVSRKREIVASDVTDELEYCLAKAPVVQALLASRAAEQALIRQG